MNFLLDTNVVSEWVKLRPDAGLMAWLVEIDEDRTFLSVITLAELRRGIDRMNDGLRRRRLDAWLQNELPSRFELLGPYRTDGGMSRLIRRPSI